MKFVEKLEDLGKLAARRAKFLAERPVPGDVMSRDGKSVKVIAVKGGTVRLSIEAPAEVLILREELLERGDSDLQVDAGSSSLSSD